MDGPNRVPFVKHQLYTLIAEIQKWLKNFE